MSGRGSFHMLEVVGWKDYLEVPGKYNPVIVVLLILIETHKVPQCDPRSELCCKDQL